MENGMNDSALESAASSVPQLEASDERPLVENEEPVVAAADDNHIDVDDERLLPLSETYEDFKRMTTVPAASLSIFLSCGMIGAVFAIPAMCVDSPGEADQSNIPHQSCPVRAFSLLIYVHVVYWFIHLIIDPYFKIKHRNNRMKGYLDFYHESKTIRRAPFYLVSVGNFALLLASTILNDYCEAYPGSCEHRFFKIDWLRGLISVECMAVITCFSCYIIQVKAYNKAAPFPDCMDPIKMDALGSDLVLKFPGPTEPELPPEEEEHHAGYSNVALQRICDRHAYVFGRTWKEEDRYVRVLQAELINFLITQVKRKNRKVVTLAAHLSRFTDDVSGLVGQPIEA